MDSGIRLSAGTGLGAFVLSTLVGAFSRNPFGTILIRALLIGIVFAVLTYGVILVYKRFLSIETEAGDSFIDENATAKGNVVDIVLPGGEASDLVEERGEAAQSYAQPQEAQRPRAFSQESAAEPDFGVVSTEEIAKEVESIRQGNGRSSGLEQAHAPMQESARVSRPSVSMDTLDVLPDLETLSDSFGSILEPDNGDDDALRHDAQITGSYPSSGSSEGGEDPALLAKAVQTLLRRDQKGQ